jgi:hypothetical protein
LEKSVRHFKNWLQAYTQFTMDSESPLDFHFWTGVATIAGALRRRVWIDMRKFQWTPNFYIVLVGPPGIANKSTSIKTGIRLLEQVPSIHFGPQSLTWQALTDALSEAIEHMKMTDPNGADVFLPMSCLTISISELGTFLKFDDASLSDVLVDLWDGQLTLWGHRTRTNGAVEIRNPWLNIIGCTTPAWLKANFPDHMIGGGLTSRIVFIYGDKKRSYIPYPDEMIPAADYHDIESKLVSDLQQIATMQGEFSINAPARQWGRDWYTKHWQSQPPHLASERYAGYVARKQTHIHKLAIVCAASRSNGMVIGPEHLQEAEAILNSAEPHMKRVFESIGMVGEAKRAKEIVAFVRAQGWTSSSTLWRLVQSVMNQREFKEALDAAVKGGQLTIERRNGELGVVSTLAAGISPGSSSGTSPTHSTPDLSGEPPSS